MKKFLQGAYVTAISFLPVAAFAADNLQTNIEKLGKVVATATPVVVALAVLGFFWGLMLYIFQSGDAEKRKKGLSIMIWGIVALFVMLSVFGIIKGLQSSVGFTGSDNQVEVPCIDPKTGQSEAPCRPN